MKQEGCKDRDCGVVSDLGVLTCQRCAAVRDAASTPVGQQKAKVARLKSLAESMEADYHRKLRKGFEDEIAKAELLMDKAQDEYYEEDMKLSEMLYAEEDNERNAA
jgi:hypothetical protein